MQQLTLDDVVRAGQQGMQFGQQQRAYKQQQVELAQARDDKAKERALMDSSEAAVRQVMTDDMAEHVANGGDPGQYKPSPRAMLRSVEARSATFAKAGDLRKLMENEVMAEKPRMQMRARALQEYEATGRTNFGEFAKDFYATLPNGVDVVGYEEVRGGGPDAPKGAPSGKTMYRLKFSNGKSDLVDPEKLYGSAQQMLQDPVATAKQMAEVAVTRQIEAIKGEERRKTEVVEGQQQRLTNAERIAADKAKGDEAFQRQLQMADREHQQRMKQIGAQGGYMLEAAKIRKGKDDDEGGGNVKNWQQANREVETARLALRDATEKAIKILLGGVDGQEMKASDRAAAIDADPEVVAARQALGASQARLKTFEAGGAAKPGLDNASPGKPANRPPLSSFFKN